MRCQAMILVFLAAAIMGRAEIVSKPREYKHENATLEGLWVYDDSLKAKRPSVLLVHQWKGLGEY